MFIAAMSTIARMWKELRCPPTEEWVKRWYIYLYLYTVECYSATRKDEYLPFTSMGTELEGIMLS